MPTRQAEALDRAGPPQPPAQDGGRCPACRGASLSAVLTVTAAEAAQHFVLKEALPARHHELARHIRSLWGQPCCTVWACESCGSGFAAPLVAGDAAFYNLAYPRVEHPRDKWEFQATAKILRSQDTAGKMALEIGAGTGAFLDLVCPDIFAPANVVALEYNDTAVGQLRRKGYTAMPLDVRDPALDRFGGTVDCLFAFQVIEHMDRLDEVFDRLRTLAVKGGSVFISVPNKKRTDYQERNGSLIDMPPNHVGRWSLRALGAFGQRHGFVTEQQETEPFSLREFLRHDLTYSYLRRAQRSGSAANRIRSLPFGRMRSMLELAFAAASVPARAGAWRRAGPQRAELGASVWTHLRKI